MVSVFNKLSLSKKLMMPLVFIVGGFVAYGWYSYRTLSQLKVNGPIYKKIVLGKDLIADILPPPNFAIESYLTLFELKDAMYDDAAVKRLSEYLQYKLKREYFERNAFWIADTCYLPSANQLSREFLNSSYAPIVTLFEIVERKYLPAIRAKDLALVDKILHEELQPLFALHRKSIDRVVGMASAQNGFYERYASQTIGSSTLLLIVVFTLSLLGGLSVFTVTIRLIIKNVNAVKDRIKDIASGQGDLTRRLPITTGDELGEMALHFNGFIDKLHALVCSIIGNSKTLGTSASTLLSVSSQIAVNAEEMSSQTATVAAAAEQATTTIASIASAAQQMSGSTNSVASAIQQMDASLNEVAKSCQKELQIAAQAHRHAQHGKDVMSSLGAAANTIGKVVEVINSIADQTNLLALNATLEAASAGEAGKGFSVVANEVKELARQTAQATLQIEGQVLDMQHNTLLSVNAIDAVAAVIEEVNALSQTIVAAVEQQSATVSEIARTVSGVSDGVRQVSRNVAESAAGLSEVSSTIAHVNCAVSDTAHGIVKVKLSAEELAQLSEGLKVLLTQFKT